MHKGTTAFCNIAFLKACSRYPIAIDWNLLIFSPGEAQSTYEKYMRDIPLLAHLPPPAGVFPVNFVRHSDYLRNREAYGLDLKPHDFYGLTFPFSESSIANIAEHFVDCRADIERVDYWLDTLNNSVRRWKERWMSADGKPQARLCLLEGDGGWSIYDSRSGNVKEYDIGPRTAQVLRILNQPTSIQELRTKLGDIAANDLSKEMSFIRKRGLAFEENGRYLALA